jgi:RecB family exonuclease
MSYSSMHVFKQCPRRYLVQDVLRLSPIEILEQGAVDPTRFGSALHAVLQLVKQNGAPPDEGSVVALGRQYELDGDQLERLRRGVDRFTRSATASKAVAHDRVYREMPFALPIATGECILVGNIDLYARTGEDTLIVDYKSGTSGTADELTVRYELQAKCYALAALKDGGDSVEVVFVRPEVVEPDGGNQEIPYRFGRLDEPTLRREVETLYREIATSAYEPLSARDETICGYCAAPVGLCPNARP